MIKETMADELLEKLSNLERQIKEIKQQQAKLSSKLKILETEKEEVQSQFNLIKIRNRPDASEWINKKFPWSDKIDKILKQTFEFDTFRPKQLAAINATLSKKDVLLLMPTGGGKSLTYQLPAVVEKGLTLVVSPLLSLIEDQLIALKRFNIEAATINGSTNKNDKKIIHQKMVDPKSGLKLLFVTPEWVAKSKIFMSYLQKCFAAGLLERIAIDEVHCCSTWGHDFRPEYNYLGLLKPMFPGVPFLGLTATATMSVLLDTQKMLGLEEAMVITAPFNRPNLYYKVVRKSSDKLQALEYIVKLLRDKYAGQSGIIYTTTVKETEELTASLKARGIKVGYYHAQMEPDHKRTVHERWLRNHYLVVVATVAFGMGIDKPDVRFVIHYCIPKSMEAFYQESGRAGRDGKKADCILMYNLSDYLRNVGMVSSKQEEKNVLSVLEYSLELKRCRRALIATHFEEAWDQNQCKKMCDHCKNAHTFTHYRISPVYRDICKIIDATSQKDTKLTLIKLLDAWYQMGSKELRIPSLNIPKFSKEYAEYIISFLLLRNYLKLDKGYTLYSVICYIQKGNMTANQEIIMPINSSVDLKGLEKITSNEESDFVNETDHKSSSKSKVTSSTSKRPRESTKTEDQEVVILDDETDESHPKKQKSNE